MMKSNQSQKLLPKNVEVKDCGEYQVEKKDENGKGIEFFQWFPSSLLSKPARSPVRTLLCYFNLLIHFTNFQTLFS